MPITALNLRSVFRLYSNMSTSIRVVQHALHLRNLSSIHNCLYGISNMFFSQYNYGYATWGGYSAFMRFTIKATHCTTIDASLSSIAYKEVVKFIGLVTLDYHRIPGCRTLHKKYKMFIMYTRTLWLNDLQQESTLLSGTSNFSILKITEIIPIIDLNFFNSIVDEPRRQKWCHIFDSAWYLLKLWKAEQFLRLFWRKSKDVDSTRLNSLKSE